MTTYYVSSGIGDDGNAGTSTTAPLATLQAAANLVKPGDTVEVMNGTYTGPAGGVVVNITTSGTAAAPITFEAMPGQTPVIDSSGCWQGININANNIVINGFTVVGDEKNFTQAQATAGYSSGNASLDGSGIVVNGDGTYVPNHIIIENNTVYNEPGAGISVVHADYVTVLNNVVHDTSNWSAFGSSGISIWESMNSDTNPGVHMTISGNTVYDNAQLVPTLGGNIIYDGEGIILDTNPNFVGQMLVENNTVHGNGSSGIESFQTDNAVITGNTVYGNDIDNVQAASNAEIFINSSTNDAVTNNTFAPTGTTPPPGSDPTPPAAPVISGDTVSDNIVMLTGTAQAGSIITVFDNSKELGIAPTNSSGAWTFTTGILPYGNQSFTATTTDVAGNVSPLSSALAVSLEVPLVVNGSFTTGNFSGWTLGGNDGSTQWGPPIFIDTNAEGGSTYAAGMGSIGADGTLSQTIATTAGQTYTLSFWLQNEASGTNDFKAIWNGQTLLSLTNAAQSGYTQYTYTVTATGSTTTLEFSAANGPSQWDLDNISLTASGTSPATTLTSITESPSSGDLNAGKTVTLTLGFGAAVTVASGTPTLTLNDGGTATYSGGSGTNALTFSYTVAAGQNTSALAATAVNLNSATIKDGAGNAANFSLSGLTQSGPQIDTLTPSITSLTESPASGDLNAGKTVTLTLNLNEAVTVTGGTPTLTLNDGGTATYSGGSGTNALTFSYTVAAGQNTSALAATAVNLNSATIKDGAGNAANLSLSGLTQSGPQIDTLTPSITSLVESPASGDLNAGKTVTLTLNLNEAVTVAGGTPTLTLNDGGTATYSGGSGTNALTFSYTVAPDRTRQRWPPPPSISTPQQLTDGAGNAANLSLTGLTQSGPQIDTITPAISSLVESPASGDLNAGKTVTLTLNLSEAVTVAGGTPTLTLNDGGTATYTGGSGSNALTFSYTVGAGQNTAALAATGVNLNSATITDGAGNVANLSLTGLTQSGPQIDTMTPTVSSLVESPASGDLNAGKTVTLTLNLNEAVTVAGGTPTLTLNDGGTATYTGGSGSNALTFSYTVAPGRTPPALAVTAVNLNSATVTDGAGNAANLSLTGLTQSGPQIDTTTPTITSLVESPVERRSQCRQDRHADTEPQRGGDGGGRHPDADAQRRRHRHLYRRLRQQCADLQLHRRRRAEHLEPGRHRGQSQLGDRHRRRRQCRQPRRSPG